MAIKAMQKEGSNSSVRGKFKRAAWDDVCFYRLLDLFSNAIAPCNARDQTTLAVKSAAGSRNANTNILQRQSS